MVVYSVEEVLVLLDCFFDVVIFDCMLFGMDGLVLCWCVC